MSSLDAIFAYRAEPWNLSIDGDVIIEAGYGTRVWNYVTSFFSSYHEVRLRDKVGVLLGRCTPFNEKQKILLEKIGAVIQRHKNSWLYGVQTSLSAPQELKIMSRHNEKPELMQPIEEGGRFVNFLGEKVWKQFFETLYLLLPGSTTKVTDCNDLKQELCTPWEPLARSDTPEITWIGHATVLLQVAGFNLLLDPAFHFCPPCFRRHVEPGIALEELPKIDVVGISHNHADHCEPYAIQSLASMQPFGFVPKNFDGWMKEQGYLQVQDHTWWDQTILERDGKKITMTSVPAQHGSIQSLRDLNKTLWQGIVIETEENTFYFSGDTALKEGLFEQIREVFPKIDVAFLPIAPEEENAVHVDCEQALIAFERVGATKMIPIHWGAYRQSKETVEDPLLRLQKLLDGDYSHLKDSVYISKVGERISLDKMVQEEVGNKKAG